MNIFEAIGIKKKPVKSGVALVRFPTNEDSKKDGDESRSQELMFYKEVYEKVPLVTSIINVQSDQAVQEFHFEGPNKEKLTKWSDEVNLTLFFHRVTKSKLLYGDAFAEVIMEGEKITKLKLLNSIWMTVYRTGTGKIIGYSQIINDKEMVLWGTTGKPSDDKKFKTRIPKIDSIVHFKYNVLGSEKYGRSVIKPLRGSVESKVSMENNLGKLLDKYVAPLIWAKVGSDEMPAQSSAVTDVANNLRDLQSESEIATTHLVDLKVLGFENKGLDLKTPLDQINTNIVVGGQVPPVLLGISDGLSDKSGEVQLRNFGRHIKSIQRELKVEFEDNIIFAKGLGTQEDKLVWSKAEEREWEMDVDMLRGLVTDGIITPQKANDLLPPRFEEKLPDPMEVAQKMAAITGQNQGPPGANGPRESQGTDKKVKDNPNNPTKTTQNKNSVGRVDKSARKQ